MYQKVPFTAKCGQTTSYIALCAVTALLSCFAGEYSNAAVSAAANFIGDISVMAMFTLYFAMAASSFAEAYPEKRFNILCAADCSALVIKNAFAALCAVNGSVMIHAAALIVDTVFSRVYTLKCSAS